MVQGGPTPVAMQRDSAISTVGFDDEDGLMQKASLKTNATARPHRVEEKIAKRDEFIRPANLQPVAQPEPEEAHVTSANVSSPARRHRRTELELMDQPDWNTDDRRSRSTRNANPAYTDK